MAIERTLAIIKPDAVEKKYVGRILARIEEEGFAIVAMRMIRMTRREAEGFYAVHRERPFFGDLTAYMSSGQAVAIVLEKDDAIASWRRVMGATNPAEADKGTIRELFGESIERNATHGSDARETSAFETAYFFSGVDRLDDR